ncbi:MAG TPA: diguanylate cyclase [Aquabacterium sp.]|uniref:GGDEF domain-containing protein n=1 Tax=Aquabacterium sp. TaxID=1872578 RepID=UPI002E363F8A|nr:diguanylate cyclase [Aquabacterium sp.]HEX5354599.1 diguanylate cyclase [Aquabacterium sp.]
MNSEISTKLEIERALRHRSRFVQITPGLAAHYQSQREADFNRLVDLWSPLLILAFTGCLGFGLVFFRGHLIGLDLRTYAWTECLAIGAGLVGLLMARHARWRGNTGRWIPWMFGFIIAVKVASTFQFHSPQLAYNQTYMTLIVLLVGTLALQQSLLASFKGMVIGLCAFSVAPFSAASAEFGLLFLGQYLLAGSVCLFVSFIKEDRDRVAFLQARLLHIEKLEVNRLASELALQVSRDSLTGLFNRRHLEDTLKAEWDRARRNRSSLSMLMIDVDHFKQFNDLYGHPTGDQCLQEIARLIAQVAQRPADIAARFGGEEFIVLLPDTKLEGAIELARMLVRLVDDAAIPHQASSTAAWVTVSVGVSSCTPHELLRKQDLLDAADKALYAAKHQGRHGFAIQHASAMNERAA